MTAARAIWRPPWYLWCLAGLAGLALIHHYSPARLEGHWLVLTPVVVAVGVLAVRELWELPPALTMCAAIALRIFSGAWGQIGLGGIPLDRLVILLVLLQVFLRAPGAARLPSLRLRNVHLLMAATVLYLLVSAATAGPISSGAVVQSVLDEFGVAPYLAFLIAPAVFAGRRERDVLLATLVGLGLYLGFTAIFEALGPHSLVFPSYITHVDAADPSGRVNGPFQSSVAEGCATFACLVAAAMAFVQWRGRRRYVAATAALVCLFGCFSTLERGVWIAAVAGALVTALTSKQARRWIVPGAIVCAVLVAGLLAGSSTLSDKASNRVNDQRSIWDRKNQTAAGIRMIEAKPLLGFGLARYKADSLEYFRQSPDYPQTGRVALEVVGEPETIEPLHNLYVAYAVELGLVGAALWLVTLFWGVGGAILAPGPESLLIWKRGLLALAVFFIFVTFVNPKQPPFEAILLWTWAGVALGDAPAVARRRPAALPLGDPPALSTA